MRAASAGHGWRQMAYTPVWKWILGRTVGGKGALEASKGDNNYALGLPAGGSTFDALE